MLQITHWSFKTRIECITGRPNITSDKIEGTVPQIKGIISLSPYKYWTYQQGHAPAAVLFDGNMFNSCMGRQQYISYREVETNLRDCPVLSSNDVTR